jgi:hypothetical protein
VIFFILMPSYSLSDMICSKKGLKVIIIIIIIIIIKTLLLCNVGKQEKNFPRTPWWIYIWPISVIISFLDSGLLWFLGSVLMSVETDIEPPADVWWRVSTDLELHRSNVSLIACFTVKECHSTIWLFYGRTGLLLHWCHEWWQFTEEAVRFSCFQA